MSKRSYFAADVPVITAVTTPVAPNVPRGVEMIEDIGDGPAIRDGPLEKLWGGGEFSSRRNFFSSMFPVNEYFFLSRCCARIYFFP